MILSKYSDILEELNESSIAVWGVMTPQHMVEHLTQAVELSNGKLIIDDCINPPEKFPVLKRVLLSPRSLPKNFVNTVIGPELKPLLNSDLNAAKKQLYEQIKAFDKYFDQNPNAKPNNPTFGPLNKEEWIVFHTKHFTHHLTQFGLLLEKHAEK